MLEWLTSEIAGTATLSAQQIAPRLGVAAVYGLLVAIIYRCSHGRTKSDSGTLTATLLLLAILIAMVSMVIGDSVARAFSLVGALSIVRFRTVVEDTRDTAFVIFSVIVGMAAGAGLLLVPLIGMPIVGAASIALSRLHDKSSRATNLERSLKVRVGIGRDPDQLMRNILTRYVDQYRILAVETTRQGAALDLTYRIRLLAHASSTAFVSELNQVEGVQGVELHS